MTSLSPFLFAVLFIAALFSPVALGADGDDTIYLKGKPALVGVSIVSESATEVVYTKKRGTRRVAIPAEQVASLTYELQPGDYRSAVQLFSLGDFVNAVTELKAVSNTKHAKAPWVQVYSLVYLGRAQLCIGNFAEAVASFRAALKAQPNTRWRPIIVRGLVTALNSSGDNGGAKQAVEEFRRAITTHKIGGSAKILADVLNVENQLRAGKFMETAALANTAVAHASDYPHLLAHAMSLQIQALIQSKDLTRARGVVTQMQSKARAASNPHAAAVARNGEAAIMLQEYRDLEPIVHLLAKAHVENWQGISEMRRTCYLLGRSYLRAAKSAHSASAKTLARAYFEETTKRFPESVEAILARDELKKM